MKWILIPLILFLGRNFVYSQSRNNIWIFGDSAGIDFNGSVPIPISSNLDARGSCASISDTLGSLLFYVSTSSEPVMTGHLDASKVRNISGQIMMNGDSLVGLNWYHEHVIVDKPSNTNQYYIFSLGVTNSYGIYYSIVDMNWNAGLGQVTQKNIQLQNFKCTDGAYAIKHGNGRDWWVLFKRWDVLNNEIYEYLVTPAGISNVIVQNVGTLTKNGFEHFKFCEQTNKLAMIDYQGLLELYDFDRCSGIISNPVTIHPIPISPNWFTGCEFSQSGHYLYVTSTHDTSYVYQYDLTAPNILASRITLDSIYNSRIGNAFLKRGPDHKIYLSSAWECAAVPQCYPYPDSVFNYVNMNLSVINFPDSPGTACGYAPFSFYLGGKRTYYGLPNNPDYDMKPLYGSVCDSLSTSLTPGPSPKERGVLRLTYIVSWDKLFVNAEGLKGKNYVLRIFDLQGRNVFMQTGKIIPPYFTTSLECSNFSNGMYIVSLVTDKESLSKKFVKE